jgi:prepilin-type N-terminal cleavage/methylation domain-containing protein
MQTSYRCRGFTLIELLVVISIIALLISILLPALGSARAVALRTSDATQFKTVGFAIHMYANDNNDMAPHRAPFRENDGIGAISANNSGHIAAATAMSYRHAGSGLSSWEDGVTTTEIQNVPTGLGQLVAKVNLSPTVAGTTYEVTEEYMTIDDLFIKSDRLPFEPGRNPARNHWWMFRDVVFTSNYSANWSTNANFNGLQWPSGAATAASSNNGHYRTSFAYRGADYATANTNDMLTGNNKLSNLRMSAPNRNGNTMVMSREPGTINFYNSASTQGAHMLLNDGSVSFSSNRYYRASIFNAGGWSASAILPSGTALGSVVNPNTGEAGTTGIHAYKLTAMFAYADKYMVGE